MNGNPWTIFGCKGCGSAIAEAIMALADIPYKRIEVDYDTPSSERDDLLSLNPLGQVPTIILPNGQILTETLAIANYIQSLKRNIQLIPSEEIPRFWRFTAMLVAAVYPTFTYGDNPKKWLGENETGIKALRETTDRHREKLWKEFENQAKSPYFLGDTFSLVDIYLMVMVHWRPGQKWFADHCPKIAKIATQLASEAKFKSVIEINFSKSL